MINLVHSEQADFEIWAIHFKALADPLRLLIVRCLRGQSYGVLELSQLLAVQQPRLSHHLKILAQAGLLMTRREGNSIFYQRHPTLAPGWTELFDHLDQTPLPPAVLSGQRNIADERQEHARSFFTRHVEQFRERQDLIAEYPQYAEQAQGLLQVITQPQGLALEVGAGLGEFLTHLAARYDQVHAIDISKELLARAQAALDVRDAVTFFQGDLSQWQLQHPTQGVALVVYNMVLHHVSAPAEEIQRVGSVLNPGGYLLVTDLVQHDQSWAREHCGDLWLGFSEQALDSWARAAGLQRQGQSVTALRNGFQVQCLLWQKQPKGWKQEKDHAQ